MEEDSETRVSSPEAVPEIGTREGEWHVTTLPESESCDG